MDDTFSWGMRLGWRSKRTVQSATAATTRFGGDGADDPVLIAVISAPVEAEMAKDALAEAGLPAYVKQNSLGQVYGLSVGSFGTAEVWTPPAVAEQARDVLIGIGLLQPDDNHDH
jgi:hypothetical protein